METDVDFAALLLAGRVCRETILNPLLLERRAQRPVEAGVQPAVELQHPGLDRVDLLAGREAVGAARVDPGVELVEEAGDPDHEELVQVGGVDRAEAQPLQQRHAALLGQFEDPLVEVEPGELAIEVESGIVDRAIVLRHAGRSRRTQAAWAKTCPPGSTRADRGRAGSRRRAAPGPAPRSGSRAARAAAAPSWRRSRGEDGELQQGAGEVVGIGATEHAGVAVLDQRRRARPRRRRRPAARSPPPRRSPARRCRCDCRRERRRRWRRRGPAPRPRASRGRWPARRAAPAARPPRDRRRRAAGGGGGQRRARAGSSRRAGRRPSRG